MLHGRTAGLWSQNVKPAPSIGSVGWRPRTPAFMTLRRHAYQRPFPPNPDRRRSQFDTFYRSSGCAVFLTIPKKYKSYKGVVGKIAPNLLERNFEADKPNQKWVTDVTEFSLFGQKPYLSPVLDLYSRDIVSFTISDKPVLSMVTEMLYKALAQIPDGTELILHSDQGWHYQHKQYQEMLKAKSIRQSMSRKGNCLDNVVIENFFGLLKSELLFLQEFESMEHFKTELIDYLDYYNNRRSKAKLKGLPPAIYRQQALSAA
jgi:transposase InsO family protein